MKTPRIEEMHKYIDSTVHAYCDYNMYSELKELLFAVEEENSTALTEVRQTGIDEAVEIIKNYFEGLIVIPDPQATKDNLIKSLQDNK